MTGRTTAHGGAGDSSVLTAYGVFQGMRAAAEVAWGEPTLAGRVVGVAGVGKVGSHLVRPPGRGRRARSSSPTATSRPVDQILAAYPQVQVGRPPTPLWSRAALDVYAPCALGGALTDEVVETPCPPGSSAAAPTTSCPHPGIEKALEDRGIIYAPDYCVNAGGLIQVADELDGFSFERAQQRATGIFDTTAQRPAAAPQPTACLRPWRPTASPNSACAPWGGYVGSG